MKPPKARPLPFRGQTFRVFAMLLKLPQQRRVGSAFNRGREDAARALVGRFPGHAQKCRDFHGTKRWIDGVGIAQHRRYLSAKLLRILSEQNEL